MSNWSAIMRRVFGKSSNGLGCLPTESSVRPRWPLCRSDFFPAPPRCRRGRPTSRRCRRWRSLSIPSGPTRGHLGGDPALDRISASGCLCTCAAQEAYARAMIYRPTIYR